MAKIPQDYPFQLASPSQRTITERNKFAGQLDDFTTFTWANVDMFAEFGAFVINEKKGSLKMYNGASFSNNYTKQQYQDGYTNLSGITFNTQQITFTIGVYWISIEDYRVMMNLLHPYAVDMLSFDFEPKYGYECKLANIKDSTRYVLGKETISSTHNTNSNLKFSQLATGNGEGYRYYTELTLTFEVIGKQCAKQRTPLNITEDYDPEDPKPLTWKPIPGALLAKGRGKETINEYITIGDNSHWVWNEHWPSDLDFPVTINLSEFLPISSDETSHELRGVALIRDQYDQTVGEPIVLFDISFKNLKMPDSSDSSSGDYDSDEESLANDTSANYIAFTYDSEQGLVYWQTGEKAQILSLLSINHEGKRFVESMQVNRFFWPGRLDYPEVGNTDYKFVIQIIDVYENFLFGQIDCSMRNRTNII